MKKTPSKNSKDQKNPQNILEDEFSWEGPAIGLLDLDAFFTSVEQLDHPAWRGKPVVVGGDPESRGVVSTASYEARKYGIHSAMPSAQAKRLCKDAIWTHGNMARYKEMSQKVMAIIQAVTPRVEQVSIDEAFFEVTPGTYAAENPLTLCRDILKRIDALGISASIGLGTCKAIAKIASEIEKPRGFTVVPPGTEEMFLHDMPIRALSGIGPATEAAMKKVGIVTLGQIRAKSPEEMRAHFGKNGISLYERVCGIEGNTVPLPSVHRAKSLSHDETFPEDLTQRKEIEEAIKSIGAEVGRRLRKKKLKGQVVTLRLKFSFKESHTAQRQLPAPSDNEYEFIPYALDLLGHLWRPGIPVRLVSVGLSHFEDTYFGGEQLLLLDELEDSEKTKGVSPEEKRLKPSSKKSRRQSGSSFGRHTLKKRAPLAQVTDSIKDKFGAAAIEYGRDKRFNPQSTSRHKKD